ncbi:reverse transcriptase domain-containing protein, partial [Tanacetum coccineum]
VEWLLEEIKIEDGVMKLYQVSTLIRNFDELLRSDSDGPELGLGSQPEARLTRLSFLFVGIRSCPLRNQEEYHISLEVGGPEGQDDREVTPPPTKEQIEGHVSALRSLIKDHNRKKKTDPIRLDFDEEDVTTKDTRIVKGKEVVDDDLRKPFKEALKTPLTCRIIEFATPEYKMPTNIKLYDGTTDPEDHLGRFAGVANSGKWLMPVWCKMFQQTLDDPQEDGLNAFRKKASMNGWTVEVGFIMGVPKIMKISSFMDSLKCPELVKRFSNKAPTTMNEMMKRLDDFVCSKKSFAQIELPKGKQENNIKSHTSLRQVEMIVLFETIRLTTEGLNTGTTIEGEIMPSHKGEEIIGPHTPRLEEIIKLEWHPFLLWTPSPKAEVEGYLVRRIYVDGGELVEVMFEHCFENLSPTIKARLKETQTDLIGFAGEATKPLGKIELEDMPKGFKGHTFHYPLDDEIPYSERNHHFGHQVSDHIGMPEVKKKQVIEEEKEAGTKAVNVTEEVMINPTFLDKLVIIGGGLPDTCKDQLKLLLKDNMDVFAWEPADMTRVPRRIIEHHLNVNTSVEPEQQKRRVLAPEKRKVVMRDVEEWVKADIVRPVRYPTWIANLVLVKKCAGDWRMCIDFKNLNSACPKDFYPLPNIDCKIERNLEAYVDDMVIKSNDEKMLLEDVAETFDNLRKINMKLNPKKCSFGVEEGKFLGYMVTFEGIRANPKKTRILADLQSPRTLKEMQSFA